MDELSPTRYANVSVPATVNANYTLMSNSWNFVHVLIQRSLLRRIISA